VKPPPVDLGYVGKDIQSKKRHGNPSPFSPLTPRFQCVKEGPLWTSQLNHWRHCFALFQAVHDSWPAGERRELQRVSGLAVVLAAVLVATVANVCVGTRRVLNSRHHWLRSVLDLFWFTGVCINVVPMHGLSRLYNLFPCSERKRTPAMSAHISPKIQNVDFCHTP
jgi:hypothetical protein